MSKSQVTIAVDPGASTGVAIFRHSHLVVSFTTLPPYNELWTTLRRFGTEAGTKVSVVCERAPAQHRHNPESVSLQAQLELAECHLVSPSEWKGHPKARIREGDHPATKHEREAIGLGRYWIGTQNARREAAA